jgi:hypothetical protein
MRHLFGKKKDIDRNASKNSNIIQVKIEAWQCHTPKQFKIRAMLISLLNILELKWQRSIQLTEVQ